MVYTLWEVASPSEKCNMDLDPTSWMLTQILDLHTRIQIWNSKSQIWSPKSGFGPPNLRFGRPNFRLGYPNLRFGCPNLRFGRRPAPQSVVELICLIDLGLLLDDIFDTVSRFLQIYVLF